MELLGSLGCAKLTATGTTAATYLVGIKQGSTTIVSWPLQVTSGDPWAASTNVTRPQGPVQAGTTSDVLLVSLADQWGNAAFAAPGALVATACSAGTNSTMYLPIQVRVLA